MTKREFWLKLFTENSTALAAAIHLCERFVDLESLNGGRTFLYQRRIDLDKEIPKEYVDAVFKK